MYEANTQIQSQQLIQIKLLFDEFCKAQLKCKKLAQATETVLQKHQTHEELKEKVENQLYDPTYKFSSTKKSLEEALVQLNLLEHQLNFKAESIHLKQNINRRVHAEYHILEVPTYHGRNESSFHKMGRISNYLSHLRSNMKNIGQCLTDDALVERLLKNQPQYLQLLQKMERRKMRASEIGQQIQRYAEKQMNKFINSCQVVKEEDQYLEIRITTKKLTEFEDNLERSFTGRSKSKIQDGKEQSHQEESLSEIIEPELEVSIQNAVLAPDASFSNSNIPQNLDSSILPSMIQIGSKRKQVFDDDIWDELEKF